MLSPISEFLRQSLIQPLCAQNFSFRQLHESEKGLQLEAEGVGREGLRRQGRGAVRQAVERGEEGREESARVEEALEKTVHETG